MVLEFRERPLDDPPERYTPVRELAGKLALELAGQRIAVAYVYLVCHPD